MMNNIFISIWGFNIYWYSILILIAIILGLIIITKETKKNSLGKAFIIDLSFYLIPVAIIGARLYYVIFNFSAFKDNPIEIFEIWNGGLAIYGAVIASIIFIIYYCREREKNILLTLDTYAPALILGQAIGRWGNFLNKEAHGGETTLSFLQSIHLPDFVINGMYINGTYYQPTFLYESLWCLLGFFVLIIIRNKTRERPNKGSVLYSYFIWYGIGRFFIEGLRTDSLYIGSLRISQLVSIALILIGIIGLIINKVTKKEEIVNVKL